MASKHATKKINRPKKSKEEWAAIIEKRKATIAANKAAASAHVGVGNGNGGNGSSNPEEGVKKYSIPPGLLGKPKSRKNMPKKQLEILRAKGRESYRQRQLAAARETDETGQVRGKAWGKQKQSSTATPTLETLRLQISLELVQFARELLHK